MNINDLSKEEMKNIRDEFLAKGDTELYRKANRIFILAIIGLVFAVVSITFHAYANVLNWGNVIDGFLLLFTLFFIHRAILIKRGELNKYIMLKNLSKKLTKSKKKAK